MGFRDDFLWGAASAAHQVEGAYLEDGKTAGIWDALCEGHIRHGEDGKIACDHYHRYEEDVALMKQIGLKSYRFSISWPRIVPEKGRVNEKGLQFYRNLVEELRRAGIEPIVTLYHWNLPMWAYEEGGWECEEIAAWFAFYVRTVVEALSDRVSYWITFNEPQMFIGMGHILGSHAPFQKRMDMDYAARLSRNVMLAHGEAVRTIRRYAATPAKIGLAPHGTGMTPLSGSEEDIQRAREETFSTRSYMMSNAWWLDPMILGQIPEVLKDTLTGEDIAKIAEPLDFFGVNLYQSANYQEHPGQVNPLRYPGMCQGANGWAVTPEVMYWLPKFFYERYHLPVMITENGLSCADVVMLDGKVHDPQRIDYIHRYLKELKRAAEEGIPVIGYQMWSIMDNFEWADGYDPRFGLIYVDYRTQERILKDSAYAYAELIRTNGENL